MESGTAKIGTAAPPDEDTIYKSLTHEIRRKIILLFSHGNILAFSEIKKQLDPIDSPSLAYHLKSLQALIPQADGKYKLSEIGEAALNLLAKVEQGGTLKRYERQFWLAHLITVLSWIAAETLVPLAYYSTLGEPWPFVLIAIVINVIGVINQVVIGLLRRRPQ